MITTIMELEIGILGLVFELVVHQTPTESPKCLVFGIGGRENVRWSTFLKKTSICDSHYICKCQLNKVKRK